MHHKPLLGTDKRLGRYREIRVRGTPREVGRQIGEAAREEIRGFAEIALARQNREDRTFTVANPDMG